MVGIPGFSKRLFEALSNEKINVILITQSSSEHSITVAIDNSMFEKAKSAVDVIFSNEIALGKVDPLILEKDLSIVALVGENMENHTGVSGRMFSAMGRNGINIRAIAQGSSEKNISAVIFTKDVKKTINILHGANYTDAMTIFRIYRTNLMQQLNLDDPRAYNTEKWFFTRIGVEPLLSVRAAKAKLRIAEIPSDEPKRFTGERKLQVIRWGLAYMSQVIRERFI
jgi:aspartokinase/homoserine dehydrogenase 1